MGSSSLALKCFFSLLIILCMATSSCHSNPDAVSIVTKALACFNDHSVYSGCQDSYRLTAGGAIKVPPEAVEDYCSGPCLSETRLVLNCVDDILYNFRFYNGASVRDMRYTLDTGCGHTNRRGDFNVLQEHLEGDNYGDYYYYGDGNKLGIPVYLLLLLSCLAFWGH